MRRPLLRSKGLASRLLLPNRRRACLRPPSGEANFFMFCPTCATQNEWDQGYCRRCGQTLTAVRLGLEGRADKSFEKLKSADELIRGGSATLVVFVALALFIFGLAIVINVPLLISVAFINLLLGSFIGLPLLFMGKAKLKSATRLLAKSPVEYRLALPDQKQELPMAVNDNGLPKPGGGNSITERTTLRLQQGGVLKER